MWHDNGKKRKRLCVEILVHIEVPRWYKLIHSPTLRPPCSQGAWNPKIFEMKFCGNCYSALADLCLCWKMWCLYTHLLTITERGAAWRAHQIPKRTFATGVCHVLKNSGPPYRKNHRTFPVRAHHSHLGSVNRNTVHSSWANLSYWTDTQEMWRSVDVVKHSRTLDPSSHLTIGGGVHTKGM